MKWIKHDTNAHRDAKLKKLVMSYGLEGYGLYWYCIEEIASNVSQHKFTFELEHDAEIIAFSTGMSSEKVETIMKKMIELNLFESSNGLITCLKLAKRLDQSMTSNPEMRAIISNLKNQGLISNSHDSIMTESRNSHARLDKNRLDKNRVKKKKSPTKRFKPPLLDDVLLYCNLRGNNVNAGKFIDFYTAKNWMIGKNKMKDWEAAVRTWEQNDEAYSKGTARSSGQSKFNPASADF